MECLDNNRSVPLKMYRMNVACRKSLYTQPGENRNKYDNGWIKKRFVFETGSISQINSKTFACTQLKYIATASVELKPILGYRITLIKRTAFPRFFSVPIIVSTLVPPNVVYIYSGIFYLPPPDTEIYLKCLNYWVFLKCFPFTTHQSYSSM